MDVITYGRWCSNPRDLVLKWANAKTRMLSYKTCWHKTGFVSRQVFKLDLSQNLSIQNLHSIKYEDCSPFRDCWTQTLTVTPYLWDSRNIYRSGRFSASAKPVLVRQVQHKAAFVLTLNLPHKTGFALTLNLPHKTGFVLTLNVPHKLATAIERLSYVLDPT